MRKILGLVCAILLALPGVAKAQISSPGSLVGGATPVSGTCPSTQFLYNNAGVLGCSAGSGASMSIGGAISGSPVSGSGLYVNGASLGQFTYGANVYTALGVALNGSGALAATTSPTFVTPTLGSATASGLTLSAITGSTQCLQVNTSGVVSGSGGGCGGGAYTFSTGLTNTSGTITLGDANLSYSAGALTANSSVTTPTVTAPASSSLALLGPSSHSLVLGAYGASRWAIDSTGNFYPLTTDAYSFGTASAVASNVYTTALNITGITGSTQCLQVSTAGLVSGTGSTCGGGGGTLTANSTLTSGFTAGQLLMSDGTKLQVAGNSTIGSATAGVFSVNYTNGSPGATDIVQQWQYNGSAIGYVLRYGQFYGGSINVGTTINSAVGTLSGGSLLLPSNGGMGFIAATYGTDGLVLDTALNRDAAGVLSLRNGTSAQSFRVANTWSSSGANYEYGIFDWQTTANVLTIGTTNGGTGLARNLQFVVGGTQVAALNANGFQTSAVQSIGTKPTYALAGGTCAGTVTTGGATAGTITLTGVCATTNTLTLTAMPTASTGYACFANDRTLSTATLNQTASTTSGVTFTFGAVSTGATDVIAFHCIGY